MTQSISIVDARPRPIAGVRVTTLVSRWPSEFARTLDKVYAAIRAGHVRKSGHNVMIYHLRGGGVADIECGVETTQRFDPIGEVVYCETPSGRAITTTHVGPYTELGASYDAMKHWARSHGHALADVCWEIYGDWHEDPQQLRTDLFLLLA